MDSLDEALCEDPPQYTIKDIVDELIEIKSAMQSLETKIDYIEQSIVGLPDSIGHLPVFLQLGEALEKITDSGERLVDAVENISFQVVKIADGKDD